MKGTVYTAPFICLKTIYKIETKKTIMIHLRLLENHSAYEAEKSNLPRPYVVYDYEHVHYPENEDTYHFICFYIKDGTSEAKYFFDEDVDINNPKNFVVTKEMSEAAGLTRLDEMGYVFLSNKSATAITPFSFTLTQNVGEDSRELEFSSEEESILFDETSEIYIVSVITIPDLAKYKGLYAYPGEEKTNETTIIE